MKKNLNSSVNLNSKAPSIRRSESRIVVADVSVVLSTPMSKNTKKEDLESRNKTNEMSDAFLEIFAEESI